MAGTSGCIPDYEVNFFGQLCKPVARTSAVTIPEPEPQNAINGQVDYTPAPRRTATSIFELDPITTAFRKNEHLIRGFSGGKGEIYRMTIEEVLAEARRDSMNADAKQVQERQPANNDQFEQIDEHAAEYHDHYHTGHQKQHGKQHPVQQEDQHQPQHQLQYQHQPKSLLYHAVYPPSSPTFLQGNMDGQQLVQSKPKCWREAMPCIDCVMEGK